MVSDSALLEAVREFIGPESSPVATPGDVAASLPVERETVRQRLLRLAADDEIRTRKVGRSRVFWIPSALGASAIADDDEREPYQDLIGTVEIPGWDDDVVADRRAALALALQLLEERGPLRREELVGEVFDEHTGDYGSTESLWTNFLQPALSTLADEGHLRRATGRHDDPGWDLLEK